MIEHDFVSDGLRAACTCGWQGRREHPDHDAVVDEWENHCDTVFMKATT